MTKERILNILMILLLVLIAIVTYIIISNRNNKNTYIEEKKYTDNYEKWYYKQAKIDNDTDDIEVGDMSLSYIIMKNDSIDICYQSDCYSTKYTINDDILYIEEGEYFSGNFKILYEGNNLYLEQDYPRRGFKVMYTFSKEDN